MRLALNGESHIGVAHCTQYQARCSSLEYRSTQSSHPGNSDNPSTDAALISGGGIQDQRREPGAIPSNPPASPGTKGILATAKSPACILRIHTVQTPHPPIPVNTVTTGRLVGKSSSTRRLNLPTKSVKLFSLPFPCLLLSTLSPRPSSHRLPLVCWPRFPPPLSLLSTPESPGRRTTCVIPPTGPPLPSTVEDSLATRLTDAPGRALHIDAPSLNAPTSRHFLRTALVVSFPLQARVPILCFSSPRDSHHPA